ncbi:hypothetical protein OC846_000208 [Tilletia horrida]|uniref:Ribosomal protein S21 n=1 Tax=Tilletia horrida TaxID=155126 RepID=A0AAN6JUZ0_9BASI|nr:hypothetical protein OC845_000424 [Tilletia horrida]KAK0557913.1 hypothetical protein OC846_000208 [Tilletia horrida]
MTSLRLFGALSSTCARASPVSASLMRPNVPSLTLAMQQMQLRAASSSTPTYATQRQVRPSDSLNSGSYSTPGEYLDAVLDRDFGRRRQHGLLKPGTPTSGRSFPVNGGDLNRAYRVMMAALRRDDIRHELRRGERYEKPNQERRRKRSERHRRRFADLVRKKVQLVMALRARGV